MIFTFSITSKNNFIFLIKEFEHNKVNLDD